MRLLRFAPLGVAVVITQLAVMPHLRLFGVVPDLAMLAAVGIAWSDGGETGAWFGFCTGLFLDLFVTTPFGMTALAYAVTAYIAAGLHSSFDRQVPLVVALVGGAAGLCSGLLFALGSILAGADQLQRSHTVVVVLITAFYNALLAVPVFRIVRFVGGEQRSVRI